MNTPATSPFPAPTPARNRRWPLLAVAALALPGCTTPEPETQPPAPSAVPSPAMKEMSIGQSYQHGKLTITLTGAKVTVDEPEEDGGRILLVLQLTVVNTDPAKEHRMPHNLGLVCDNSGKTNQEKWKTESWRSAGRFASSTVDGGQAIPAGQTVNGELHSEWISMESDRKKPAKCSANPVLLVHELVPNPDVPMGLQPTDLAYWRLPSTVMEDGNRLVAEGKRLY